MNLLNFQLRAALRGGYTLLDFAILHALAERKLMTRAELETATGASESAVHRATVRLRERGDIKNDRKHPIGGNANRAARYFLTPKTPTP